MACWHCLGSNQCDCIFCGYALPPDWVRSIPGCTWKAGKCSFCANLAAFDLLRPKLEAANINPADRRYWTRDADGHMLFDPFFEHRHAQAANRAGGDPGAPEGKMNIHSADEYFVMDEPELVEQRPQRRRGKKK